MLTLKVGPNVDVSSLNSPRRSRSKFRPFCSPSAASRSFLDDLVPVREGEAWEAAPRPLEEASIMRAPPIASVETMQRRRRLCPPIFDAPPRAGDTVTGRPPPLEVLQRLLGVVMAGRKGQRGARARGGELKRHAKAEPRKERKEKCVVAACCDPNFWNLRNSFSLRALCHPFLFVLALFSTTSYFSRTRFLSGEEAPPPPLERPGTSYHSLSSRERFFSHTPISFQPLQPCSSSSSASSCALTAAAPLPLPVLRFAFFFSSSGSRAS